MVNGKKYNKHYEDRIEVNAKPEEVFAFADDHKNFSSHMTKSSWMMGGGKMETTTDEGHFQKVGSYIKMTGKVFGVNLYLDEVVINYSPPLFKEWQTQGSLNLIVIDHYALGFKIKPDDNGSIFTVYIKYNLPESIKTRFLGNLFGEIYAKWCVKQMINTTKKHFEKTFQSVGN